MKFKTQFAGKLPTMGERNTGISLTIPGQAYTVSEMLKRLSMGLTVSGQRVPQYDMDDVILPELHKMDLVDRMALLEKVNLAIREGKAALQKEKLDALEKERAEYYKKLYAQEAAQATPPSATGKE